MLYFWNFVLHNCILISDAEQVYFKPQVTNFKMKEATQWQQTQNLKPKEKIGFSKTLNSKILNPKHQIHPKP